jgi:hypothetical protein
MIATGFAEAGESGGTRTHAGRCTFWTARA